MIRRQWFSVPFGTGTRAADDTGGDKGLTFHYLRIDGYSIGAALMAHCVTLQAAKDASRVCPNGSSWRANTSNAAADLHWISCLMCAYKSSWGEVFQKLRKNR
jgi:hypothetical protein